MLDIGWSEMAVIALLALVIIGPKDLPRVMRTMGKWAHKARAVSREFQSGIDEMIREADLEDAKKTLDATRNIGLDKVVEDTIDPTGSIKKEAQELESSARGTGSVSSSQPEESAETKDTPPPGPSSPAQDQPATVTGAEDGTLTDASDAFGPREIGPAVRSEEAGHA